MRSLLFTDHDVLILFDPVMDGAENPHSLLDRAERYAKPSPAGLVQAVRLKLTPKRESARAASVGRHRMWKATPSCSAAA